MDPNANLREQLEIVADIIGYDFDAATDALGYLNPEVAKRLQHQATRLADLVEALDGWLANKGFLPRRWQR